MYKVSAVPTRKQWITIPQGITTFCICALYEGDTQNRIVRYTNTNSITKRNREVINFMIVGFDLFKL